MFYLKRTFIVGPCTTRQNNQSAWETSPVWSIILLGLTPKAVPFISFSGQVGEACPVRERAPREAGLSQ